MNTTPSPTFVDYICRKLNTLVIYLVKRIILLDVFIPSWGTDWQISNNFQKRSLFHSVHIPEKYQVLSLELGAEKLMIIFWHYTVTPNLTCSSWALSFVLVLFSLAYHAFGLKISLRLNASCLDFLRCRPLIYTSEYSPFLSRLLHSFAHRWSVCVYLSLLFIFDYIMINNKTYGWTVDDVFCLIQMVITFNNLMTITEEPTYVFL